MKRKVFNFGFALSATVLLFSSCLGDNNSTYQGTNDFVYITSSNSSEKYAVSSEYIGLAFTGEAIKTASSDRCYFASYKLSTSDMAPGGQIFNAQDLYLGKAIPQSSQVQFAKPPTSGTVIDSEIFLSKFSVQRFHPANVLGDKWLLSINIKHTEGDEVNGYLYYDNKNQFVDAAQTPLAKNKIILDILFTKKSVSGKDGDNTDYFFVADLDKVRTSYTMLVNANGESVLSFNEENGTKYAPLQIIFRYKEINTDGTTYTTKYFPSANGSNSSVMTIIQS